MNAIKVLCLMSVLLWGALVLNALTPAWQWAVKAGGGGYDGGYDIATDSQGNQYVA